MDALTLSLMIPRLSDGLVAAGHSTVNGIAPLDPSIPTVTLSFTAGATQGQKDAANTFVASFDWSQSAQDTWVNLQARTAADNRISSGKADLDKLLRASAGVMVDEINSLRDWITSFKAAVAAATSLANLQTRIAALADMPDRTLAQAKTAIGNKIDAGTVD